MDTQEIMEVLEQSCRAMSQQEFLSIFTENINRQASFSGSLCFKLDSMKERLNLVSSTLSLSTNSALTFSLDDNQNPIVYALTSNKPYLVQDPCVLYGSVCDLAPLINIVPLNDAMLCYPFRYGENKVNYGVFVFFASFTNSSIISSCLSFPHILSCMSQVTARGYKSHSGEAFNI